MAQITNRHIALFQQTVWGYYDQHGRHDLPWRLPEPNGIFDPYKVMVSEVMLQQTQVNRVMAKYTQFLKLFPRVEDLAGASLGEVLVAWQGLGYNRRAKFLWQAAQMILGELGGAFPQTQQELTKLPGVGINTAGAIVAYAYNQPVSFIETNIRTVYIHHFFNTMKDRANSQKQVDDKEVAALVEATLPKGKEPNVRFWYWALMDYGTFIKQTAGNKSRASKSYIKQSAFIGSKRAVRGAIVRYLSQNQTGTGLTVEQLAAIIIDPRLADVLRDLVSEGMVCEEVDMYRLT